MRLKERAITPEPVELQRRNFTQRQIQSSSCPVQSKSARFGANRPVDADPSGTASLRQLRNGSSEKLPVFGIQCLTPHLNSMGRVCSRYIQTFTPERVLQHQRTFPPVRKYSICIPGVHTTLPIIDAASSSFLPDCGGGLLSIWTSRNHSPTRAS